MGLVQDYPAARARMRWVALKIALCRTMRMASAVAKAERGELGAAPAAGEAHAEESVEPGMPSGRNSGRLASPKSQLLSSLAKTNQHRSMKSVQTVSSLQAAIADAAKEAAAEEEVHELGRGWTVEEDVAHLHAETRREFSSLRQTMSLLVERLDRISSGVETV